MPFDGERRSWALRGMREVFGIPGIVLMTAMVGFAALAREVGMDLPQTVFTALAIWALPSSIIVAGGIANGLGLASIAIATTLASVRFMPMVMAIAPEMRAPRTRTWTMFALAHVVAITAWVHARARFPDIPREYRAAFFGGFAWTIALTSTLLVGIAHWAAATLPPQLAAGLVFLTPIYFLSTLWASARLRLDRIALLVGLALGPIAHAIAPSFGLVGGGLVGGAIAWAIDRRLSARVSLAE